MFTFAYFLDFLVLIGNSIFMKKGKSVSNPESVVLLFERMEVSTGFANFEQKMHRTQSSASSLLPPDSIKQKIAKLKPKKVDQEEKDDDNLLKILTGKEAPWKERGGSTKVASSKDKLAPKKDTTSKRKGSDIAKPKTKSVRKGTADSLDDETFSSDVNDLVPRIKKIFQYYCSFGEPGNTTKLKSSMFQKMLKDAKIIK